VLDAYTYLSLGSGNKYSIKASRYSSDEFLKLKPGQTKDAKVDGFFNKQKKDAGDWRQMEWE
jgi:hypothetical protein